MNDERFSEKLEEAWLESYANNTAPLFNQYPTDEEVAEMRQWATDNFNRHKKPARLWNPVVRAQWELERELLKPEWHKWTHEIEVNGQTWYWTWTDDYEEVLIFEPSCEDFGKPTFTIDTEDNVIVHDSEWFVTELITMYHRGMKAAVQ